MKNAIVTGCASGIGLAICKFFSNNGIKVYGIDKETIEIDKVEVYKCDISEEENVNEIISAIEKNEAQIHYLVNVVGVICRGKNIWEYSKKEWEEAFYNNFFSMMFMTNACINMLKKATDACIINISSEQSIYVKAYSSPYIISKAAVNYYTRLCALEMQEFNIRVNAIALGTVKTNILKAIIDDDEVIERAYKKVEKSRTGLYYPEDVLPIVQLLISYSGKIINGQIIVADGGKSLKS